MTEQTPTPPDPAEINIEARTWLDVAREHVAMGEGYLENFESQPRDPRQVELATAHFAAATAIATIELASRKPTARGR